MVEVKKKTGNLQYFRDVISEKVVACDEIRAVAAKVIRDADRKRAKWRYDEDVANRYISFVETFCRITTGRSTKKGRSFKLEPFQRAITATIFGFVDKDGIRKYQEVFIVMGRKNGKTTWAAALELALLVADGEGSPEIYNVATAEKQAKKGFNDCLRMINVSPSLRKMVKKRTGDIYFPRNMGKIEALSSNTSTLDGLDVHGAILDEMAAWKNRDLYDLVKQGIGGRDRPLIISITTNGFVRENIFDSQFEYAKKWIDGKVKDDRFIAFIYKLDDKSEWSDPSCWIKSNPGLGRIKKIDYMRGSVQRGKDDPNYFPTMMVKDFNMTENAASAWLTYDEAFNGETFDFGSMGFRYGIGGIDAADSVDLAAACMLCMRPDDGRIYKRSMYWIPESVVEESARQGDRGERDSVPYSAWIDRGLMRVTDGNTVDKLVFLEWFEELRDEFDCFTFAIGYDPWHMTEDSVRRQYERFVGKSNFEVVRQGSYTMSDPMKMFRADLGEKRIVNNANPIDIWCRLNAAVKRDGNDNLKLIKNGDRRKRIDGLAAELDAYIALLRKKEEYLDAI